jgi:hypothetical protein
MNQHLLQRLECKTMNQHLLQRLECNSGMETNNPKKQADKINVKTNKCHFYDH